MTTDLEDKNIGIIIQANRQRWEIEESFRIMKSEFEPDLCMLEKKNQSTGIY